MFCKSCGAKLKDGAKFCQSCGAPTDSGPKTTSDAGTTVAKQQETSLSTEQGVGEIRLNLQKKKKVIRQTDSEKKLQTQQKPAPTIRKVPQLVKCICNHCDQHIEFEKQDLGETVNCPLCNLDTVLYIPEIPLDNLEEFNDSPPELWNPKTSTFLGVIFLPVMIWVHAKNWEALKKSKEANLNYIYLIFVVIYSFILIPLSIILFPEAPSGPYTLINTGIIAGWVSLIGLKQVYYIKKNTPNFHKKSWGAPILLSGATIVAYLSFVMIAAYFTPATKDEIKLYENEAVYIVTEIIEDAGLEDNFCDRVEIQKEISRGTYKAKAWLDDGVSLEIIIEIEKGLTVDMIYVEVLE
jgi:hypothetical protein